MPSAATQFTSANAREMAARGAAAKAARLDELREAVEIVTLSSVTEYSERRLNRVRLQLDAIDKAIAEEQAAGMPDTKRLKELVEAQSRMNIQERELSMRPAPGTTKPTSPKSPKTGNFAPPPPADDVQSG